MFRTIRISILLVILAYVSIGSWVTRARSTAWEEPLDVVIYPINADRSDRAAAYIRSLNRETFAPIEQFLKREARRYGVNVEAPVTMHVAREVGAIHPPAPRSGNPLDAIYWSLQFRLWAWMHDDIEGVTPHVRLFVQFYDPYGEEIAGHSVGLQNGLIGLVQAMASDEDTALNNMVIAHEMLHTVGASDKYDPESNHPYFPDGYAEPKMVPLLPQKLA
ncbi:MAG: hypothetical protein EXR36_05360 [Betaproteobacteria bacterium]|nr:hypothetical protein [Betaproteobacteria bacterium]